jgi:hypothetical protein
VIPIEFEKLCFLCDESCWSENANLSLQERNQYCNLTELALPKDNLRITVLRDPSEWETHVLCVKTFSYFPYFRHPPRQP